MKLTLAAIAAPALLALSVVTPARAAVTQPAHGDLCSYQAIRPDADPNWTIVFTGGPFGIADEDDPTVVHTGTVTCTIQDGGSALHTDPDTITVTSAPSAGVVVLPPTVVTAPEIPDSSYLCTQLDVDGTTLYWHDPADRNEQGWWTTSTSARCENSSETLEHRFGEDPPGRQILTAAAFATGRFITVSRASAGGAVLAWRPLGWSCTDVHSGLPVSPGSTLAVPDPGVSCVPDTAGPRCDRVEVSGVLAPTTLGRVAARSTCGSGVVERWLVPAQGALVQAPSTAFPGLQSPPLTCGANEDTTVDPVYTVVCGVFTT